MWDKYDLVVFARGMHAALLCAEAADKGLKVALVCEDDLNNQDTSPFVFTHFYKKWSFLSFLKSGTVAQKLKKAANHLVIQSELIQIKKIGFLEKMCLRSISLLSKHKITILKKDRQTSLKYATFKFSSDRMTIGLLKYARQKGVQIFQYSSLISSQCIGDGTYKINLVDKLKSSDFSLFSRSFLVNPIVNSDKLDKNQRSGNKINSYNFTYPQDQIAIKEIVVLEKKDFQIFVIPWFGHILFKISGAGILNLKEAVHFINKNIDNIAIREDLAVDCGLKDRSFFLDEGNFNQLILHDNENQIFYSIPNTYEFFYHFNKVVNKILKHLQKGRPGKSLINNTVLPTCNLGIGYHPLRMMELADEKYDLAKQIVKSPQQFKKLFYRYGSDIDLITNKAYEFYNLEKDSEKAWLKAEIWYCKHYEMCLTPESFIQTHSSLWMEGNKIDLNLITNIYWQE